MDARLIFRHVQLSRWSVVELGRITSLRFCCAANVVTAGVAREPDGYRDCSNRLLDSCERAQLAYSGSSPQAHQTDQFKKAWLLSHEIVEWIHPDAEEAPRAGSLTIRLL